MKALAVFVLMVPCAWLTAVLILALNGVRFEAPLICLIMWVAGFAGRDVVSKAGWLQ